MPKLNLNALQKVGTRGVVYHDENNTKPPVQEYGYFADNKNETWRKYPVVLQVFAKSRGLNAAQIATVVSNNAPVAVFGTKNKRTILVNIDGLKKLGPSTVSKKPPKGRAATGKGDFFLIHENAKYYAVARSAFHPLSDMDAGEAKVVVMRGGVIAAIPDNVIPYGTNCVLVNVSELKP
jgi:hypothetical protein